MRNATIILISITLSIGCGTNKSKSTPTTQTDTNIVTKTDTTNNLPPAYKGYDSKEIQPEKTDTLTLIAGWDGIDSKTIDFKSANGVTLTAWEVPTFIKWRTVDETKEVGGHEEIEERFLNKKYIVTYTIESSWYEPGGLYEDIMVIKKMKLLK